MASAETLQALGLQYEEEVDFAWIDSDNLHNEYDSTLIRFSDATHAHSYYSKLIAPVKGLHAKAISSKLTAPIGEERYGVNSSTSDATDLQLTFRRGRYVEVLDLVAPTGIFLPTDLARLGALVDGRIQQAATLGAAPA